MVAIKTVTVTIPTYNGARFLAEAIQSILDQTLSDFELLVVDDGSQDTTEEVVRSFSDQRIQFFGNETHLGLPGNWNRALSLARGKYIYLFSQDDVMLSANLERKVSVLERHPEVGLVFSRAVQIDSKAQVISGAKLWADGVAQESFVHKGAIVLAELLGGPNFICPASVLVRNKAYEKVGAFNTRLHFACDWEMWMRIAQCYGVAYLAEPLVKYRWHDTNETYRYLRSVQDLEEEWKAKESILANGRMPVSESAVLRELVKKRLKERILEKINNFLSTGNYWEAARSLWFGLRKFPVLFMEGVGRA